METVPGLHRDVLDLNEAEVFRGNSNWICLEQEPSVFFEQYRKASFAYAGEAFLLKQAELDQHCSQVLRFESDDECCEERIESWIKRLKKMKPDKLMALGGGKCLDSAKCAADHLQVPLVTVPTSAATCAAASAVAVIYDSLGHYRETIDLKAAPQRVILNWYWLRQAPQRLLVSGMYDTAAKWLEAALTLQKPLTAMQHWALQEAKQCWLTLLEHGEKALEHPFSTAFEQVVQTNILKSALSSSLGAPAWLAHVFCNVISCLEESRFLLHGERVARGLLFQSVFLKMEMVENTELSDWNELKKQFSLWGFESNSRLNNQMEQHFKHLCVKLIEAVRLEEFDIESSKIEATLEFCLKQQVF